MGGGRGLDQQVRREWSPCKAERRGGRRCSGGITLQMVEAAKDEVLKMESSGMKGKDITLVPTLLQCDLITWSFTNSLVLSICPHSSLSRSVMFSFTFLSCPSINLCLLPKIDTK